MKLPRYESMDPVNGWFKPEPPEIVELRLARYSEALDEIDAMNGQNPFSAFAADPLSLRVKALLAEMREEGARIRAERGEAG